MINKIRRDKIRNEYIRTSMGVTPLLKKIEVLRLRWLGHLETMGNDRIAKKRWMLFIKPTLGPPLIIQYVSAISQPRQQLFWNQQHLGKSTVKATIPRFFFHLTKQETVNTQNVNFNILAPFAMNGTKTLNASLNKVIMKKNSYVTSIFLLLDSHLVRYELRFTNFYHLKSFFIL
jgi:hypothetical protein